MSYFTDFRDSVEQSLGIDTGADAAQAAGTLVAQVAQPTPNTQVKLTPQAPVPAASSAAKATSSFLSSKVGGVSVTVIIIALLAAALVLKKGRR